MVIDQEFWELQTTWAIKFVALLYRDSKKQYHAGLPETKSGAKYLKTCATKYAPWQVRTTTLK